MGIAGHLGVKKKMIIMNPSPKIHITRRWNQNGKGKVRTRRPFALVITVVGSGEGNEDIIKFLNQFYV